MLHQLLRRLTNVSASAISTRFIPSRGVMDVHVLPALGDNYMYLLVDKATKLAAAVDPVEPDTVLSAVASHGVQLHCVLTTHHHWDHAGGNDKLVAKCNGVRVYAGDDRVNSFTEKVADNTEFKIGELNVRCLHTPCHTSGHFCYCVTDNEQNKAVFTGDTMFIGGCGRFFEGNAQQMYDALVNKLGALPDDTVT